jgi:cytoskeletal protein RodZ
MSKDQSYGFVIFLISVIVAIVYLVAFFGEVVGLSPYWHDLAVGIPVLLFVLLVLVISGWIGWTMLTTPPPAPLEPEPPAPTTTSEEEASDTSSSSRKSSSTRTRRRSK